MRIGFMGRTRMLFDTIKKVYNSDEHSIAFIWTSKAENYYQCAESEFKDLSEKIGCPFFLSPSVKATQDSIDLNTVDVIISINFINIVPQSFLNRVKHGILNAHVGDLPRYKGNACVNWAILNEEEKAVLTVHEMASDLDAGPIYIQKKHPINNNTYITDIYEWMQIEVPNAFLQALDLINKGQKPIQQKKIKPMRTFPRKEEDSLILWNQGVTSIYKLIRASSFPFSGAFCYLNHDKSKKVTIYQARLITLDYDFHAIDGQILEKKELSFIVASKNRAIEITDFMLSNHKSLKDSLDEITASQRNRLTS